MPPQDLLTGPNRVEKLQTLFLRENDLVDQRQKQEVLLWAMEEDRQDISFRYRYTADRKLVRRTDYQKNLRDYAEVMRDTYETDLKQALEDGRSMAEDHISPYRLPFSGQVIGNTIARNEWDSTDKRWPGRLPPTINRMDGVCSAHNGKAVCYDNVVIIDICDSPGNVCERFVEYPDYSREYFNLRHNIYFAQNSAGKVVDYAEGANVFSLKDPKKSSNMSALSEKPFYVEMANKRRADLVEMPNGESAKILRHNGGAGSGQAGSWTETFYADGTTIRDYGNGRYTYTDQYGETTERYCNYDLKCREAYGKGNLKDRQQAEPIPRMNAEEGAAYAMPKLPDESELQSLVDSVKPKKLKRVAAVSGHYFNVECYKSKDGSKTFIQGPDDWWMYKKWNQGSQTWTVTEGRGLEARYLYTQYKNGLTIGYDSIGIDYTWDKPLPFFYNNQKADQAEKPDYILPSNYALSSDLIHDELGTRRHFGEDRSRSQAQIIGEVAQIIDRNSNKGTNFLTDMWNAFCHSIGWGSGSHFITRLQRRNTPPNRTGRIMTR